MCCCCCWPLYLLGPDDQLIEIAVCMVMAATAPPTTTSSTGGAASWCCPTPLPPCGQLVYGLRSLRARDSWGEILERVEERRVRRRVRVGSLSALSFVFVYPCTESESFFRYIALAAGCGFLKSPMRPSKAVSL